VVGIRSFVAVELDDNAREALTRLQGELKRLSPNRTVRWTKPETIHLTLQFLGDVPPGDVDALGTALQAACTGLPGFDMTLQGLGVFPNPKRPRIVWVGISERSGVLRDLQRRVGEALAPLGFPPEKRPFKPHLTIGRAARDAAQSDLQQVGALMGKIDVPKLAVVPVDHVCLMKSDLRPSGAVYTPLKVVTLS
jgi:RNA 2',3'-cyclic 3'-phosphodiesterase